MSLIPEPAATSAVRLDRLAPPRLHPARLDRGRGVDRPPLPAPSGTSGPERGGPVIRGRPGKRAGTAALIVRQIPSWALRSERSMAWCTTSALGEGISSAGPRTAPASSTTWRPDDPAIRRSGEGHRSGRPGAPGSAPARL